MYLNLSPDKFAKVSFCYKQCNDNCFSTFQVILHESKTRTWNKESAHMIGYILHIASPRAQ